MSNDRGHDVWTEIWSEKTKKMEKMFFQLFPIAILILCETPFTCFTCADTMPSLSKNHGVFKIAVFSHCFLEKKNQQLRC